VYIIGEQSGEVLEAHTDMALGEIEERVRELLGEVKLPSQRKFSSFAGELSRGEAQRAMLAAALVKGPSLLIADEPFSGLDPPVAQGISDLIRNMQRRRGMAMVMVNHNLAQVASLADRLAVMYGGRIVEEAPVGTIYRTPRHPYTEGLLGSIPWPGVERLRPIGGEIPRLIEMTPAECSFADRCPYVEDRCRAAVPPLEAVEGGGRVACRRFDELDLRGVSG
jgi:oligopeptide/dipeptide ABC transporter ATP-binding protein